MVYNNEKAFQSHVYWLPDDDHLRLTSADCFTEQTLVLLRFLTCQLKIID